MIDEGYSLSDKSKFVHTLDSYVYAYTTLSGSRDVLKIEINYSNRVHVLKPKRYESTKKLGQIVSINRLENEELIGSKINALLVRTTPRDVYDVYLLFKGGYIKNDALIRKIAIFYVCLGSDIPIDFEGILNNACSKIKGLTFQKIKETLIPVIHKGTSFDVDETSGYVYKRITDFFKLDEDDLSFIESFNDKRFSPEVLFQGFEVEDVKNHPMGIWKTK